jgi:hypothetical protein
VNYRSILLLCNNMHMSVRSTSRVVSFSLHDYHNSLVNPDTSLQLARTLCAHYSHESTEKRSDAPDQ